MGAINSSPLPGQAVQVKVGDEGSLEQEEVLRSKLKAAIEKVKEDQKAVDKLNPSFRKLSVLVLAGPNSKQNWHGARQQLEIDQSTVERLQDELQRLREIRQARVYDAECRPDKIPYATYGVSYLDLLDDNSALTKAKVKAEECKKKLEADPDIRENRISIRIRPDLSKRFNQYMGQRGFFTVEEGSDPPIPREKTIPKIRQEINDLENAYAKISKNSPGQRVLALKLAQDYLSLAKSLFSAAPEEAKRNAQKAFDCANEIKIGTKLVHYTGADHLSPATDNAMGFEPTTYRQYWEDSKAIRKAAVSLGAVEPDPTKYPQPHTR